MSRAAAPTLVIIPAYNEEASLSQVIEELRTFSANFDILLVNDGSRDRTEEIAVGLGLTTLTLPFNSGVGGAMRLGYKYARDREYLHAVQLDADGQHNPQDIQTLVDGLNESDICIGARFAGSGDYQVEGSRKIAMKTLSFLLSKATHSRLTDTTSGFRAANKAAISFFADNYPAEYLGDTIEVLVASHKAGLTISQIPVTMRERLAGSPSQNWGKSLIHLLRSLLALSVALTKPASK